MRRIVFRDALIFAVSIVGALTSCKLAAQPASTESAAPKTYSYRVVQAWPHDKDAFTQGLVYIDGVLLEGTGLVGHSTLRRVDLESGRVLQSVPLEPTLFGEGVAVIDDTIYQITWRDRKGFLYDLKSFQPKGEFTYEGEGWGLATDGTSLILSDGTERIRFIDPKTFAVIRTIQVQNAGRAINNLNELEFIDGEIYANVWQSNWIVRIDPANGRLLGVINLAHLLDSTDVQPTTDVLNGIAYDAEKRRLFVTGKKWPKLFEIELTEVPSSP